MGAVWTFEKVLSFSLLLNQGFDVFAHVLSTRNATLQLVDPEEDTKKTTHLLNMVLCLILECYAQSNETTNIYCPTIELFSL